MNDKASSLVGGSSNSLPGTLGQIDGSPELMHVDDKLAKELFHLEKIHKDHPLDQVIGDLQSATQTRNMSKNLKEHGFVSTIQQRTNHKDLQNCLFACFLSQEEPKKDERGIVIRSKARLVAQGYTQEERIDYDEVFALVARIEAIRLFLAYASFKDFMVFQMDVKSVFLYGKIEEEVSQTASTPMEIQKSMLKDEDGEEVDVHMYRSMIGSLMYLTSSRPDIMFAALLIVSWSTWWFWDSLACLKLSLGSFIYSVWNHVDTPYPSMLDAVYLGFLGIRRIGLESFMVSGEV
ncbi:putative ribonuclease H-like domain-containing protein [Tanacetum coccineum]